MSIKLYYFALPGLAETSRLLLTGGGIAFEDVRFAGPSEWPEFKPKTPFGQVPVLDVDGTLIAQAKAIAVYCAKIAGFYPEDPLVAAQADMVINHLDDTWQLVQSTFKIQDPEEKIKARQELLAGPVKEKLSALDKLLEGKDFVAGDKLSHGDVALFTNLSFWISGFLDGVPATFLNEYPALKHLRNRTAEVDFIKAYYANETEGVRSAYKPDA